MSAKAKKKKNRKSGDRELSVGTVVLLCIALVATAAAVYFIIKATSPQEPAPTLPPLTQTASDAETTSQEETPTPETTTETAAVSTETPTPTPNETTETPVETTETPTPTPVEPLPDTQSIYLEIPAEEDMRKDGVEIEGVVTNIGYFLPKIHADSEEIAARINGTVTRAVQRTVDRITDNLNNNFDPIVMEPEDREINVTFYKSAHTVSVILRYELISGSGETVAELYGVNFDAEGNAIRIDDILTDRAAAAGYVKLNADAGDEPDFSILEEGNAFCSAWYIDGEKLTVLYNGKTLDLLFPFILSVEFPAPTMYKV